MMGEGEEKGVIIEAFDPPPSWFAKRYRIVRCRAKDGFDVEYRKWWWLWWVWKDAYPQTWFNSIASAEEAAKKHASRVIKHLGKLG